MLLYIACIYHAGVESLLDECFGLRFPAQGHTALGLIFRRLRRAITSYLSIEQLTYTRFESLIEQIMVITD
jgi:hypothetical protein